jgi:hypothetical protein
MVIRTAVFTLAMASSLLAVQPTRVLAQEEGSSGLRAANLARMKAENLNGGLQVYRAAACMHQRAGGACLVKSSKEGYLFRFPGGGPGWQQLGNPATVETELLVAPDGRSILQVIYNGPPRERGASTGAGSSSL